MSAPAPTLWPETPSATPDAPLIDTHCHFEAGDDAVALLREAAGCGVGVIAVGGGAALNVAAEASGTWFAQGFDWSCEGTPPPLAPKPGMVAVGELGFDFHWRGPETAAAQRACFEAQAAFARAHGLPVIVHTREADALTLETLRALALPRAGVIHSYTGGVPLARAFLDLGYHISFSGIVTFRNADALREVARYVPGDRILLETDAPYLAPVPHRGRRNRPAYVRATAAAIAALRGEPLPDFAARTTANARALFRLEECVPPPPRGAETAKAKEAPRATTKV